MFQSLRSRLLLSYTAVILVCLALVGFGLLLFVRASPLWTSLALLRLELVAREATPMILGSEPLAGRPLEQVYPLLERAAAAEGVRILLVDRAGVVRFDSGGAWEGQSVEDVNHLPLARNGARGTFRTPEGARWDYVGRLLPTTGGPVVIAFVAPQTRLLMLAWFAENLLPPLLAAGAVALVLSILLAWLMARSVARPLQRAAAAAGAIARGDLAQRAPLSGPQEVRDLGLAFNHMAERVAASQQAQRDLVANISHELKTPLTSIQGFSEAILDGTAADEREIERAARIIHDEAERMRWMVDELLGLARFDAGQVQLDRLPVELAPLLRGCVERLTPQAEAAGDQVRVTVEETLRVTGDPDWLNQVFVNLLDNAIRHTRDGRVEIAAHAADGWVEVQVSDTGEGIPPEDLGRIFERFYQADKSRYRRGGVGLGLSIAREVVRLHGGEITAESTVGAGSRFTVRLPQNPAPLPPARSGPARRSGEAPRTDGQKKRAT